MAVSLYELTVPSYLQVVNAVSAILAEGRSHAEKNGLSLDDIVETKLAADMLPFRFQLVSVAHHSIGAIRGTMAGEFGPPAPFPEHDYAALEKLVADAAQQLEAVDAAEIDAKAGSPVVFRLNDLEIPFTAENFALSFSLPNLHFHATTTYDILRMKGVAIGKRDYLGQMRMGV